METALSGRFENGVMTSAKQSSIIGERCHYGMKEIQIATPKMDAPKLKYTRPNRIRIADQPKVMDALDRKNIFIKTGEWGDGVFAKRNLLTEDVIAYYSGLLWRRHELFPANQTTKEKLVQNILFSI